MQTFAAASDRRRLGPVALKGFVRIVDRWKVSDAQAAALLNVSRSTWGRIRAGKWNGLLSQDQLTRVSALVGIFTDLHILIVDGLADRWPVLPNRGPVFGGKSPIEAMIEGGIPRMLEVRQHVEALRMGI